METIAFTALITLIVLAVVLVVQLGLIARRAGVLIEKLEGDLPELLRKADEVLGHMQSQLQQVDSVVESAQAMTARVHATATSAQQALTSPLTVLGTIVAGAGRTWRDKFGRRGQHE